MMNWASTVNRVFTGNAWLLSIYAPLKEEKKNKVENQRELITLYQEREHRKWRSSWKIWKKLKKKSKRKSIRCNFDTC